MMRTREDGATIKEDFDDLIVVCVGSQDLAYSLLLLLLVLIDVVDNGGIVGINITLPDAIEDENILGLILSLPDIVGTYNMAHSY